MCCTCARVVMYPKWILTGSRNWMIVYSGQIRWNGEAMLSHYVSCCLTKQVLRSQPPVRRLADVAFVG